MIPRHHRKSTRRSRTAPSQLSAFEQYLLAEYDHIADAHFKTIDAISTFFKHYLVIVSIPVSAFALLLSRQFAANQLSELLIRFGSVLCLLLIAVAVVGLGVFIYIINLRLDAMLYARTINGIRKYFYDLASIDIYDKLRMRILPQSPQIPSYFEKWYFLPVVFVFGVLNASSACLAWAAWGIRESELTLISILTVILSTGVHVLAYYSYARYREHRYLRSRIIGVDIDGVLNEHRQQFCDLLKKHTGKEIDPRWITTIPVHDCEGLDVTRDDEIKVFNDPEYWTKMPVATGAPDNLRRIRKAFNMKIYVFTHRPWPMTEGMNEVEKEELDIAWRQALSSFHEAAALPSLLSDFISPIKGITKLWLRKHRFEYDWLMVEKGSDEVSDPHAHINNRFYKSREMRIKLFVEDDARKATKLAYICDVVFLLDQPYNQGVLPGNVIRVKSWDEIYRAVRALC